MYCEVAARRLLFYQNEEQQHLDLAIDLERIYHVRPATQQDAIHAKSQDIPKLLLALYGAEGETSSNEDPETLALEGALARERETHTPQWAPSASGSLLVFHGHVFQAIQYRTPTNCEACAKPLSHFISPPPALECKRCHLKIHREHITAAGTLPPGGVGPLASDTLTLPTGGSAVAANPVPIDMCKVASVDVKSLLMMFSSPRDQKYWISQLIKRIPKPAPPSSGSSTLCVYCSTCSFIFEHIISFRS